MKQTNTQVGISVNFVDTISTGTAIVTSATFTLTPAMTSDFTATINPSAGHDALCGPSGGVALDVDSNGQAYIGYHDLRSDRVPNSGCVAWADTVLRSFTNTGSQRWSQIVPCGGNAFFPELGCALGGFAYDNGGRLTTVECVIEGSGTLDLAQGKAYRLTDGDSLVLHQFIPSSDTFQPSQCSQSIVGAKVDDNDVLLLGAFTGDNKLVKWDTSFVTTLTASTNQPLSPTYRSGETFALFYRNSCGGGCPVQSFNVATGALSAQVATDGQARPEHKVAANAYATVLTSSDSVRYQTLTATTTPVVSASFAFTPARIRLGDVDRPSRFNAFDLDGGDRFVTCGGYQVGLRWDPGIIIASDTGVVLGTHTPTNAVPLQHTSPNLCAGLRADTTGGFYVLWAEPNGQGQISRFFLEHYSSNLLTAKTAEPQAVVPINLPEGGETTGSIPGAGSDLATGIRGFCAALMGDSTASLFFCGLIFVVVVFLAMATAFAALTKSNGLPAALAGSIGGFGMMIFNVFSGVWEAWAGVVLIMVTAGIIAWMVRKMALSFSGGGGGGGESS